MDESNGVNLEMSVAYYVSARPHTLPHYVASRRGALAVHPPLLATKYHQEQKQHVLLRCQRNNKQKRRQGTLILRRFLSTCVESLKDDSSGETRKLEWHST